MPESAGPKFLDKKYSSLRTSSEVQSAAKHNYLHIGENLAQNNPSARIQNFLDRLNSLINPPSLEDYPDFDRKKRNLDILKRVLYEKFIIKPDNPAFSINPEIRDIMVAKRDNAGKPIDTEGKLYKLSAIDKQILQMYERGQGGDLVATDLSDLPRQFAEATITDQKNSLDSWIDYLSSSYAPYPDWLKYWTFRSILQMSTYDKDKKAFGNRSYDTTKTFPELNPEALSYVLDAIEKKYIVKQTDLSNLDINDRQRFEQLLAGENFAKLYAWAIEKIIHGSRELLNKTEGVWIKFPRNSDPMTYRPHIEMDSKAIEAEPLVPSLQKASRIGYSTGWCTAGESTARQQLKGGDFYVYYSLDRAGNPTIPRVAIRMEGDKIGEVRGVTENQNLDPYIYSVVEKKLQEFPDGKAYQKRTENMKRLTEIYNKSKADKDLTREEVRFLYELDGPIEGFGQGNDPRVYELRKTRDLNVDAAIILEYKPEQIALNLESINAFTKVYIHTGSIGSLEAGIFQKLQLYNVNEIYLSFPGRKIKIEKLKIDPIKTPAQLLRELELKGISIGEEAKAMMLNTDFTTLQSPIDLDLIRLRANDLPSYFSPPYVAIGDIYQAATDLGLDLCPPEIGPYLALHYGDELQNDETVNIAMKPILGLIFDIRRREDKLKLSSYRGTPYDRRFFFNEFIFCIPRS